MVCMMKIVGTKAYLVQFACGMNQIKRWMLGQGRAQPTAIAAGIARIGNAAMTQKTRFDVQIACNRTRTAGAPSPAAIQRAVEGPGLVQECRQSGGSVALAHGINASIAHRWLSTCPLRYTRPNARSTCAKEGAVYTLVPPMAVPRSP